MKRKLLAAVAAIALTLGPVQNAHAIFGLGDIVYDPANHAENILTAARTLQQINNQVQQLANEAQMLAHQAQNLTRLPNSVAPNLQASLARLDNLIIIARGIAYQSRLSTANIAGSSPNNMPPPSRPRRSSPMRENPGRWRAKASSTVWRFRRKWSGRSAPTR